ncbi:MAG: response regulator transcription factor [Nitrososphaerales archaeon]
MKFDVPRHEIAIVIVDDSQHLLRIYEGDFEAAGLEVVAKFSGGKDVLAFFASSYSAASQSIVLLDQRMPEMDGTETARQLKRLNPNQRIILATQQDLSEFHIDEKLFDGVIEKPFTIVEFLATIENLSPPVLVKGIRIFRETKEIESLLRNITNDSKERLCSVHSANHYSRWHSHERTPLHFCPSTFKRTERFHGHRNYAGQFCFLQAADHESWSTSSSFTRGHS